MGARNGNHMNFSIARLLVCIACSAVVIPYWRFFYPYLRPNHHLLLSTLAFAVSGAIVVGGVGGLLKSTSLGILIGFIAAGGSLLIMLKLQNRL